MKRKKQIVSLVLCLCLVFSLCPQTAAAEGLHDSGFSAQTEGLCEHHPQHTDQCGYTEGDEGTPCTFVCEICNPQDSGETEGAGTEEGPATPGSAIDSAVSDVQTLIDALPTAAELENMSQDEQGTVYEQVQAAYDAYNALSDEQKGQIAGAEKFDALFAVFNSVVNALVAVGNFNIDGGKQDTDYSYSGGVLTILTDTELTISNTNSSAATSDRIVINDDVNANITLNGVNIQAPAQTSAIDVPSGASLTLTLANGSTNTLTVSTQTTTAQPNNAAIHVPEGASLTIQCASASGSAHQCSDTSNCGELSVTGGAVSGNGYGGTGIGGNASSNAGENGGTIRIIGGNITVTGGAAQYPGPGIGGGTGGETQGGNCGTVYITGGNVAINGGSSNAGNMSSRGAAGIGGGNAVAPFSGSGGSGGTVVITGGTIAVTGGNGTSSGSSSGYGGTGIGGGSSGSGGGAGGTVIILTEVTVIGGKGDSSGGGTTGTEIGGGLGSSGSKGDDGNGIRPSTGGNNTYEVYGDLELPDGVTFPGGITINIPDGASLSLPEGASWPDNVTITGNGSISPKWEATINIIATLDKPYDGSPVSLGDSGYTYTGDATTPPIIITWHEDNNGTIGGQLTDNAAPSATGTYWVKVSAAETNRYAAAVATKKFTIRQPLDAPKNPNWDTTTPGQATWSAVTNASGYSVQLYKNGTTQGSPVTASGTSCNFQITEAGSYTFTVTATGSGAYSDSSESSQSSALHTVSFDTNGGTGTIPMQLVTNGGYATEPTTAPPTQATVLTGGTVTAPLQRAANGTLLPPP